MWETPDDGIGFERYLESQEIPLIRVPFVRREPEELAPQPNSNFSYWKTEDDATRLARMLQCEEMRTDMVWRQLDQMTRKRDFWQRGCACAYGLALAALITLASAVWR